ncbi:MAG: MBL fold metallo-hydrolase [Proteobacteria bacterium]|nr:MBL fold metallo-hydrolase [Pseudomonadota bacterium]
MSGERPALSRRTMLIGTAAAALAPLAGAAVPRPARAAAPMLGAAHPTHYRFKLGAFEITTIWDGAVGLAGPHPIFGNDQPAAEVQKLAEEARLPKDRMAISFTPVMVNTGRELVMFDSGNGAGRRPNAGRLAASLGSAGFSPDQVDVVVVTHCHGDHIGGLMEGGKPLFANARYVIGRVEYDFWSARERADGPVATNAKLVQSNVVPLAPKMTFLEPEGEVAGGIRAVGAYGHTPGHMAFHLESEGKRFLIWADTSNHYVASVGRPDWHVSFDMDKAMAVATRRRILDMAATDRLPVTGYHMPFPAVGFVERKDTGYRWLPASYELNL